MNQKPVQKTVIIGMAGDTYPAFHLMKLLQLDMERVSFHRKASDVDISLILGVDLDIKRLFQ